MNFIEQSLLKAVVADPDNDTPRLQYAEYLKANGAGERGALIETQIALSRMSPDEREASPLFVKAMQLEKQVRQLTPGPRVDGLSISAYRRGLPEAIFVTGEAMAAHGRHLFAVMPVRELSLDRADAQLAAIAAMPELRRLRKLTLQHCFLDDGLRALSASPQLTSLEELVLYVDGFRAEGMKALAAAPWTGSLTQLAIYQTPIGSDGAAALAASPHLRRLEALKLRDCEIGAEGARALAASPVLATVRELDLSKNPLGAGAGVLGGSPHLGQLRALRLNETSAGDDSARGLAASSGLGELRSLELQSCYLTDAGAAALAAAAGLPRLAWLDLTSNGIGEAGAEALAASAQLPALGTLGLSYNAIYVPGAVEDWTDWNGAVVGQGSVRADTEYLQTRFGRRFKVV